MRGKAKMSQQEKPGTWLRIWTLLILVLMAGLVVALGQLGASWAQPQQSDLRDTIPTRAPSPTRGPSSTPSPTAGPCVGRVLLRETEGGYQGTSDTWLSASGSTFPQPKDGGLRVKGGSDAPEVTLIRFELQGQGVPADANILKAELLLYVDYAQDGRSLDVAAFRVLRPWSEANASWINADAGAPWAAAGCNGVGTDRLGVADDTIPCVRCDRKCTLFPAKPRRELRLADKRGWFFDCEVQLWLIAQSARSLSSYAAHRL